MTTGRSGERREVLVTSGVALTLLAMVALLAAAGRVPTGDGPHLAATTFEIADALRAGDLATAFGTWSSRVSPQPPAGYAPGVLAALFLGDRWLAPLLTGGRDCGSAAASAADDRVAKLIESAKVETAAAAERPK